MGAVKDIDDLLNINCMYSNQERLIVDDEIGKYKNGSLGVKIGMIDGEEYYHSVYADIDDVIKLRNHLNGLLEGL